MYMWCCCVYGTLGINMHNNSPWIHQLAHRSHQRLTMDITTDIVIVGAGIAGIATLYHLLRYTDKNVVIVDAGKLAHGATGHNAGQVVAHIERPFADIVRESGLAQAAGVIKGLLSGWDIIAEMYTTAGLTIPFSRFIGYDGYTTVEQVRQVLDDIHLKRQAGLVVEQVWLDQSIDWNLPAAYQSYVEMVQSHTIKQLLEITHDTYIAAVGYQKGVINSALFCEQVMEYLLTTYPDRCLLFEHTPISKIVFHDTEVVLDAGTATLVATDVVLCTNGFESLRLMTAQGLDLDESFHHIVRGTVSYMSGYLEPYTKAPMAVSYFTAHSQQLADPQLAAPYLYVTRRGFEYDGMKHNLVCIGGPESHLDDRAEYLHTGAPPHTAQATIDAFKNHTYAHAGNLRKTFTWHGLMGYTPNGIRRAGKEKRVQGLYYNLGCNGIGILSSLFGGKKVAEEIAGVVHEPSLFDPE